MSKHQSRTGESARRYSPELPYRPLVSPPSVEDKDACAIYASVRKDATPSHEPLALAIPALQKMLHRAGNVDGEGDGCGVLVDIPRKIWAEEVRAGGHDPSLTLDPAFAIAHVFVDRSQDLAKVQHDAHELLGQGGFRILAERTGAVDSTALGPTAREEEPYFWQLAGLVADPENRNRVLFDLLIELEQKLDVHVPSFSATTCVYKVMGAPKILGEYYPDLRDERFETIGCFGHNRYSTNTWPSFKRVQPFSVLGHNGEINTIEQLRQEARMLGVPIQPGSSDSQDLNRTIDTLVRRDGLSLAEAMELVVPPIVDEIRGLPEELHRFYMYLRLAMGPFAQGPVALIARHADECVFSADALGLRPLWQLETGDDFVFSSEPASSRSTTLSPSQSRSPRARRCWSRSTAKPGPRPSARTTRCCGSSAAAGWSGSAPRTRGPTTARLRQADRSRAARCRGTRMPDPKSRSRSKTASSPASAGSATTSSSSSRWPRTAPSRSARSATTARSLPCRRSARTLPTTSRRRSRS